MKISIEEALLSSDSHYDQLTPIQQAAVSWRASHIYSRSKEREEPTASQSSIREGLARSAELNNLVETYKRHLSKGSLDGRVFLTITPKLIQKFVEE